MERRLAAVLVADIVGYSRLMNEDEESTLRAVKTTINSLIDPKVTQYHGRIIKLTGDGALMEFASAVDATVFAVEVQCAMRERNHDVPEERRIEYRIGINIGDIIIESDDIYGDGVNIAARLESLADPGGICVAQNVFDQVKGKINLTFQPLGERLVKNIPDPISAYGLVLDDKAEDLVTAVQPTTSRIGLRTYALGAGIALIIAAALVSWWQPWNPRVEPALPQRMAFALPDKPSIAVLPFTNMSGDRSQEYFSDGMTEDLITDLSKVSGLFVISRNSTFTYKGKSVKVRTVAEELGVRYVLEGSVRRAADKVRINAQLIDATTGGHVWADRYDGKLADVFTLQDRVTRQIVTALALRLTPREKRQLAARGTDNLEAYDLFLKGWSHYINWTPQGFRQAIPLFEKSLALDLSYGRAYAALASIYWQGASQRLWYNELGILWGVARSRASQNLKRALEYPTPLAHRVASLTYLSHGQSGQGPMFEQDFDRAISEARKAVVLDSNNPEGYVALAHALTMSGKPEEAIDHIDKAMRLNPKYPSDYLFHKALARFGMDDFKEAARLLEQALQRNPQDLFASYLRVPTYALLGRKKKMATAIDHYKRISPVDIGLVLYQGFWGLYRTKQDNSRIVRGLRIAGLRY